MTVSMGFMPEITPTRGYTTYPSLATGRLALCFGTGRPSAKPWVTGHASGQELAMTLEYG